MRNFTLAVSCAPFKDGAPGRSACPPLKPKEGLSGGTVGVEQATVGLIGGFDLWDLGEGLGVEVDGFWGRAKTQPGEAALGSGCARAIQIVRRRANVEDQAASWWRTTWSACGPFCP